MSLSADLLVAARKAGVMIATAESCTAGLIAGAITDTPGSSAIFDRGFVTYTNAAKTQMLGVLPASLAAYGAVSPEVAAEMATGALARSDAAVALSVTGIAGPGGSDHKPEGRVCFGMACGSDIQTETVDFGALGRTGVRSAAVDHGLTLLLAALNNQKA